MAVATGAPYIHTNGPRRATNGPSGNYPPGYSAPPTYPLQHREFPAQAYVNGASGPHLSSGPMVSGNALPVDDLIRVTGSPALQPPYAAMRSTPLPISGPLRDNMLIERVVRQVMTNPNLRALPMRPVLPLAMGALLLVLAAGLAFGLWSLQSSASVLFVSFAAIAVGYAGGILHGSSIRR